MKSLLLSSLIVFSLSLLINEAHALPLPREGDMMRYKGVNCQVLSVNPVSETALIQLKGFGGLFTALWNKNNGQGVVSCKYLTPMSQLESDAPSTRLNPVVARFEDSNPKYTAFDKSHQGAATP